MENGYGLYSPGSSGWTSMRNEEFQEEDVWGVVKERKGSDSRVMNSFKEPSFIAKRHPTAIRAIPKFNRNSTNFHDPKIIQHSAPVNIPDWSKIYGTSSNNSCSWLHPDSDEHGNDHRFAKSSWESDEEEEEEEEGNVVPPHEWIAKKNISSFSVCEGAGRTLKGRDLSRVRNAVLTKTGFLESNH